MKSRYKYWLQANFILIAGLVLLTAYTAVHCYISDSEFWAMTVAKELFNPKTTEIGLYYKLPFYLILNIPHGLADDNVTVILLSRLIFAIFFAALVVQLYRLFKILTHHRVSSLLALGLMMSTFYFITQGFRVRSDMLSILCFVNLLLCFFKFRNSQYTGNKFFAGVVFWNLLMILVTPKAVYLTAIFLCAVIVDSIFGGRDKRKIKLLLATFAPCLALVGLAAILSSYRAAWKFFIRSQHDFWDFHYLQILLKESPVFAFVLTIAVLREITLMFKDKRKWTSNRFLVLIMSILGIVILLAHNHKMPFFIASMLPIVALPIAFFIRDAVRMGPKRKIVFINLSLLLFVVLSLSTHVRILADNNNTKQFEVIREIEKYLSDVPQIKYYDTIGVLPKTQRIYAYMSPNDELWQVNKLRGILPDVIVYVGRSFLMEPEFTNFLTGFYLNVGTDFWVRVLDKSKFAADAGISLQEIKDTMKIQKLESDRLFIYEYRPGRDLWHRPSDVEIMCSKTKHKMHGHIKFSDFSNLNECQILNHKDRLFSTYPPHSSNVVRETGELKRLFSFDNRF